MKGPLHVELLQLLWRTAVIYVLALLVFRAMGKQSVGKLAPFDAAVIIIIGEAAAIGLEETSTSILMAIVPIVLLGLFQVGVSWLSRATRTAEEVVAGREVLLIKDGEVRTDAMARERMTQRELMMGLRQQGMERVEDVKAARLEVSGALSVIPAPGAKPLTPDDLRQGPGREALEAVLSEHWARVRAEVLGAVGKGPGAHGANESPHTGQSGP